MNALSGTRALTGLALRRDRFKLSAYVLGLAGLGTGMLAMYEAGTHQALVDEVELFASSPALRMFGVFPRSAWAAPSRSAARGCSRCWRRC